MFDTDNIKYFTDDSSLERIIHSLINLTDRLLINNVGVFTNEFDTVRIDDDYISLMKNEEVIFFAWYENIYDIKFFKDNSFLGECLGHFKRKLEVTCFPVKECN